MLQISGGRTKGRLISTGVCFWILLLAAFQLQTIVSHVHGGESKEEKLGQIQTDCVKYFQQTPHGKCTWVWKTFSPTAPNTPSYERKYTVAYNNGHVFWSEEPTTGFSELYILNDEGRTHWLRSGAHGGFISVRRLSCFDGGNPMMGCVIHPRYVGTFLKGIVGDVIEEWPSPRGVFSDATIKKVGIEEDEIDGEPVWAGIYKWGYWDLKLYYTKSTPTLLKRSLLSVLTNNGVSTQRVELDYKIWDCGVQYPTRIEYWEGRKKKEGPDEEYLCSTLDVSEFRTLDTGELKSQFQLAALNPPEQVVVNVLREDCNESDHFHYVQGDLIPFTDEELEELKNEQRRIHSANSSVSDSATAPSAIASSVVQTSSQWGLWFMLGLMILGCVVVAIKVLKKDH